MRSYREITVEDHETGLAAYLVVDSTDKDISFGGTRIDLSVTREMVVELADNMSLKLAGHGSPVGGAKAGLRASPDDPRLKEFLGRFASECRELLSSTTILGKDMGAKQWMLDEIYRSLQMPQLGVAQKHSQAAKCPERPCDLDGYIRNMTGKGVFWSIEQALNGGLSGARVLIQGFGVVGYGVACHLDRAGARIVGISDCDKAILDPGGISLDVLMAGKDDNGLLIADKFPDSCIVTGRDELLIQSADVLVLAAGSYVVSNDIAARIQTPLVVEGANLALMPDARNTLHLKAVRVVPDVVANSASAALVGHQIASGNTLSPPALWAEIETNIKRNTDEVERVSKQLNVDSRSAFRHVIAARSGTPRKAQEAAYADDGSPITKHNMEFRQSSVPGSSGAILNCLHTALDKARPSILIALPFGVPAGVARAAFEKFEPDFNVVTWESRYVLNLDQEFSGDEKLTPDEHVEDMLCILKALEIDTCRLIGYCSGAGISLLAAKQYPDIFTELILVNGEYQLFKKGHTSTNYQRSIDTFLPEVATSRKQAGFIFSKMAEIWQVSKGDAQTELDKQINLPFSREEYLFRYAKNYMAYRDFDALDVAREIRQNTFVLTGQMDEHSSMENSEAVGDSIPRSKKFIDDRGDHYEFCRAGSPTLDEIGAYLAKQV